MTHHSERPIIEPTRVYSREEAAEVLTVSLSTVKRLIAAGNLRVSQPPGLRRVLILGQHLLDLLTETEIKVETRSEHNGSTQHANHTANADQPPTKIRRRRRSASS
jgi:excisionase family DNA binding protein